MADTSSGKQATRSRVKGGSGAGRPAWRAFWEGLTTTSTPAAISFAIAALCALVGTLALYSPAGITSPAGRYLARTENDDASFVTREAMLLGRIPADRPRLLILGPSTVGQIFGSGTAMAREIREVTGRDWDIHMLTTPLQSPFDQFALLETALAGQGPDSPPVVVVVSLGLQRLGWTPDRLTKFESEARLGLRSRWVDEEMTRLGAEPRPRTGFYPVDNYHFVIAHGSRPAIRLALLSPAERRVDSYAEGPPKPPNAKVRAQIEAQIRTGQDHAALFYGIHRRLAQRVQEVDNARLIFIDETLSPDFAAANDLTALRDAMAQSFAEFARAEGAEFWPISADAALTGDDFYDDLHIRTGAPQAQVRTAFAARFATLDKRIAR